MKKRNIWGQEGFFILPGNGFIGQGWKETLNIMWCMFVAVWNILPKPPMEIIQSRAPFAHLEKSKGGYILVIVNHLTRFAQAYVITNKSPRTAVNKVYNDISHQDPWAEFLMCWWILIGQSLILHHTDTLACILAELIRNVLLLSEVKKKKKKKKQTEHKLHLLPNDNKLSRLPVEVVQL